VGESVRIVIRHDFMMVFFEFFELHTHFLPAYSFLLLYIQSGFYYKSEVKTMLNDNGLKPGLSFRNPIIALMYVVLYPSFNILLHQIS
jgi:hypothetical protein